MVHQISVKGICSRGMQLELDEEGKIHNLKVEGGCDGNSKGLSAMVEGQDAREVIRRLRGIECKTKGTSCPDQLARGLERILQGAE